MLISLGNVTVHSLFIIVDLGKENSLLGSHCKQKPVLLHIEPVTGFLFYFSSLSFVLVR